MKKVKAQLVLIILRVMQKIISNIEVKNNTPVQTKRWIFGTLQLRLLLCLMWGFTYSLRCLPQISYWTCIWKTLVLRRVANVEPCFILLHYSNRTITHSPRVCLEVVRRVLSRTLIDSLIIQAFTVQSSFHLDDWLHMYISKCFVCFFSNIGDSWSMRVSGFQRRHDE